MLNNSNVVAAAGQQNGTASAIPGGGGGHEKPNVAAAVLMFIGSLLYFVSPIDLIPDIIPILCHIDDFTLMGLAAYMLKKAVA